MIVFVNYISVRLSRGVLLVEGLLSTYIGFHQGFDKQPDTLTLQFV